MTSERDTAADEPVIPEGTIHVPLRPGNHSIREEEPPFTLEELRQAFELVGMSEASEHYLADLTRRGLSGRGIVWPEDMLLMVALVSDEVRERIRRHLRWTPEQMEEKLQPMRARLRQG